MRSRSSRSRRTSCQKFASCNAVQVWSERRCALVIAIAAHVQHQPPDGIGAAPAVIDHLLKRLVTDRRAGPARTRRSGRGTARSGMSCRRTVPARAVKTAVLVLALVHAPRLAAELRREVRGLAAVAQLIAQVVGDAAEGVNVAEILPQMPRQEGGDDREVLVMAMGEAPRCRLGQPQIALGRQGQGHGIRDRGKGASGPDPAASNVLTTSPIHLPAVGTFRPRSERHRHRRER